MTMAGGMLCRPRGGPAVLDGFWGFCARVLPVSCAQVLQPSCAGVLRPCADLVGGFTMVIDKGLPPGYFRDLLRVVAPFVSLWKLGFGTVALYRPQLVRQKVQDARRAGVEVYVGGTFLELARVTGQTEAALKRFRELGLRWVEVSDGTYPMEPGQRRVLIREVRARGFEVIAEVGSKDPDAPFEPACLAEQIARDVEAGARYVLVEGRDSGQGVGIYDEHGRIRRDRVQELLAALERLGLDSSCVVWEAPRPAQQKELLIWFGPQVGLGNVQVGDVLTLAAMRCGLRSDTLRVWYPLAGLPAAVDGDSAGR